MIVGVGLFGDFISCLSENLYENNQESERIEKQEYLNIIKDKYNIIGKSVVNMD